MKKIFTFAAAILASVAMMAGVNVFTEQAQVINDGNWIVTGPDNAASSQSSVIFPDDEMEPGFPTGTQTAANYFKMNGTSDLGAKLATTKRSTIKNLAEGDVITVYWFATNTTKSTITLSYAHQAGKGTKLYDSDPVTPVAKTVYASVLPALTAEDIDHIANGYEGTAGLGYISCNNSVYVYAIKIGGGTPSTDPVLNVDKEEVTLAVTAAEPSAEAVVKFTGKNLAAGEYALNVPNVADLTVSPTSVTVGEDGKLNAQVTITYASTVDVAAASTAISLTIGELSKSVAINYSAALAKQYLANSLNIEQLVLDNGVGYDIAAAFAAANIDYNNIDALDSLNDDPSKTNRNYAFLGLKLKKADAKLGCWLQAGHSIKIRFGNVGASFLVSANGSAQTMTNALANTSVESANELPFTATEDTYLEIICNSTKTLVVKQIMLDEDIQSVTLPEPLPTGINNAEEAVKAVKFFQNGQLMIEKNGVIYNAQGAIVK